MKKKTCFVVTPIGDENTAIRRHIDGIIDQSIIPALGDEFEIKVAHREYEIGSINDRVIQNVCNSDLVVANLTGLNPNVMFEIAIRYSFGKPAIVIAEDGTELPFDIVDENTIFYINDPVGAAHLKENIKKFVQKIDWSKCEYGPVFSAIKNVAIINFIESGISDQDNKNAFSFLAEKMSDLETEIKRVQYYQGFYYNKLNKEVDTYIPRITDFVRDLAEGVQIEDYIQDFFRGLSALNGKKKVLLWIDRAKEEISNDPTLDVCKKNKLIKALDNCQL